YVANHPHGGMPYGTAPLSDEDYKLLVDWAESGAPLPGRNRGISDEAARNIGQIEAFLNEEFADRPLVPRYIYEHLFLAHLHLEGDGTDRFFRLIRSSTPPGEAAVEIATRRPFDDPGPAPFYYRVIPVNGTIVHKNHIVYPIGAKRLDRFRTLFGSTPPSDTRAAYSDAAGGNPFTTFADIPAASRYQFLLDDAHYYIRNFIRGPVCHGQVAVDVIEDRFWVTFLDPDADLSVTDDTYLQEAAPLLELPVAAIGGSLRERASKFISEGPAEYLRYRQERYAAAATYADGPTYDFIWDGDGSNASARLTVYRHFDNASVVTGFVGAVPETAWVIDFPLLERIYYDLVAGFDVFGNVEHQLTTRLYMDGLRREGEAIFLSFLPPETREPLHAQWYRGPIASLVNRIKEQPVDTTTPTGIPYDSGNPKSEFLTEVLRRGPALWPLTDPINRCTGDECAPTDSAAGQLRDLSDQTGAWVKFLPDLAVLLVRDGPAVEIFSLVHDKAHSNVAFLFREAARREPDEDRLTIIEGQFGSYPNFYFSVDRSELSAFVADLKQVHDQAGYMDFVRRYGVRRSSPLFWQTIDQVQAAMDRQDAIQTGLLDINRYKDPKDGDSVE
ncbi:MAG: fatty acid cis/trans isomerase, partial [Pseudomonadota bacterium]